MQALFFFENILFSVLGSNPEAHAPSFIQCTCPEELYPGKRKSKHFSPHMSTPYYLRRLGLALRPRAGLPFLGPEGGGRTNA